MPRKLQVRLLPWVRGGSLMVEATVSRIQPSIILHVSQEQSPVRNFFRDTGFSRNLLSLESKGPRTESIVRNSVLCTWPREDCGPWASDEKSSTKILTYCVGVVADWRVGSEGSGSLGIGTAMSVYGCEFIVLATVVVVSTNTSNSLVMMSSL